MLNEERVGTYQKRNQTYFKSVYQTFWSCNLGLKIKYGLAESNNFFRGMHWISLWACLVHHKSCLETLSHSRNKFGYLFHASISEDLPKSTLKCDRFWWSTRNVTLSWSFFCPIDKVGNVLACNDFPYHCLLKWLKGIKYFLFEWTFEFLEPQKWINRRQNVEIASSRGKRCPLCDRKGNRNSSYCLRSVMN